MLYEIESDEFVSYGKPRGKIKLYPGLNTVVGGSQSDNSIGKSTFLLAIDFCFGGKSYRSKTDLATRFADKNHTVKFAFKFGDSFEYYSRSIVTPDLVNICDKDYSIQGEMKLDDFNAHLLEAYQISLPYMTFRGIVSRYMRIYGKENHNEKYPLESNSKESKTVGITSLEKLLDYYSQIEQYKVEKDKRTKRKKAFTDAKREDVLQVTVPTLTQVKKNEKEILRLEEELKKLTADTDINMSEEEIENADEIIAIKERLAELRRKRGRLISKQDAIKRMEDRSAINVGSYRELTEFFPEVNLDRLADVERFHKKMQSVLKEEISEEVSNLQMLVAALDREISELQDRQRELGAPVVLSKKFLQKHTELVRQIEALKAQNKAKASLSALEDDVKEAQKTLDDVEQEILKLISSKINEQMVRYNDFIYDGTRMAPRLDIESASAYDFYTPDDGGMGTGYKSMIVLDLSILKLTQLPAIIHDSLMFNHIGYKPLEKIMELYIQSGKQIFIAYDKKSAPTERIQQILDSSQVIHLSEEGNELFGYSWAKKVKQ